MLNNDLANTPAPLAYVVWEELVATLHNKPRFTWCMRLHRYNRALEFYRTNQVAVDAMWQAVTHRGYGMAVVTFLPLPLARRLRDRLDADNVPYRDFRATTPSELAQQLAHMHGVFAVCDPELTRSRGWGFAGQYVPADSASMLGRLL